VTVTIELNVPRDIVDKMAQGVVCETAPNIDPTGFNFINLL